jgi:hypothetical protein
VDAGIDESEGQMKDATRSVHDFAGKRIEVASALPFDEVMNRLREQTGKSTVPLSERGRLAESLAGRV